MRARAGVFVAVLAMAVSARAGPTPSPALLVLEKTDQTLAIVDPLTGSIVARVAAGPDPHEVVVSPDGRRALISNYGGPGSELHTLSVVDLQAQRPLAPIDLGPLRSPHGLAVVGDRVLFTAETAKAIGRLDPTTGRVEWVLGVGQDRTHMVWARSAAGPIYTADVVSGTITLIHPGAKPSEPDGGWREVHVATGRGPEGFDVSPDGRRLWAANAEDGTVAEIDLASERVVRTFSTPGKGANRLKFSPDGKVALISFMGSHEAIALDGASGAVLARIPLAGAAEGILIPADGRVAYVAHQPNAVAVIDLRTLKLEREISVGRGPDGMAWLPEK